MEIANVLVALGGDTGNTVPRFGVTAAEIAVLRAIHGDEAVFEVEPIGTVDVPNRAERARLKEIYGKATDGNSNSILENLYPGAAARVFETLDELELDESFYKAERRMTSKSAKPKVQATDAMPEGLTAKQKKAWQAEQAAKLAAAETDEEEEDDGIRSMPDSVLG